MTISMWTSLATASGWMVKRLLVHVPLAVKKGTSAESPVARALLPGLGILVESPRFALSWLACCPSQHLAGTSLESPVLSVASCIWALRLKALAMKSRSNLSPVVAGEAAVSDGPRGEPTNL